MDAPLTIKQNTKKNLKSYSHEEVMKTATEYFNGDELAANVWLNKYALKDSFGNIYERTPDDMHKRIAKELARVEKKYPNPMSEKEIYAVQTKSGKKKSMGFTSLIWAGTMCSLFCFSFFH